MISRELPLIKEKRLDKLIEALTCIDENPYHRIKQKDCILRLYPGKTEKSVFRGMIIPSTRHLGLIVGFNESIRTTCNGKLLVLAQKPKSKITRTVILELDNVVFNLIDVISNSNGKINLDKIFEIYSYETNYKSDRQLRERIRSWINILKDCELVKENKSMVELCRNNIKEAATSLTINSKISLFKPILFDSYSNFSSYRTAGSVDISELRKSVAELLLKKYNLIVTESQFDKLLSLTPMITKEYMISLGQSMGAEQQLFYYNDNYYRTLKIQFFKEMSK